MTDDVLRALADGPRHLLRDLGKSPAPSTTGLYALWHQGALLYVGMVRVDPRETTNKQADGIRGRLNTYRRCRLASDFALGCAIRYVIPTFTPDDLSGLGTGTISMRDVQGRVRDWVWANVEFSTASTLDGRTAGLAETVGRSIGLPGFGPPAFNPILPRA